MDNAGCHPPELKDRCSNIKTIFLPPNTTSKLQSLDLGITQNFKIHYQKLLLRFVISKIDECDTASEVIKSVNILQAIRWVAQAWEEVKQETISKRFRKAGVLGESFSLVSREHEDRDPFDELECTESSDDNNLEDLTWYACWSNVFCWWVREWWRRSSYLFIVRWRLMGRWFFASLDQQPTLEPELRIR